MNYIFRITEEFTDEFTGIFATVMPKERVKRFYGCNDNILKKQNVAAYLLLCFALNKHGFNGGLRLPLSYTEEGKPYLSEGAGDINFNFSHSGEYILCTVSDREVGVDIQIEGEGYSAKEIALKESLIKLSNGKNTGKIVKTCEFEPYCNVRCAVSGEGNVRADFSEISFDMLSAFLSEHTSIGDYIKLNNRFKEFAVDCTPLEMFKRAVSEYPDRTAVVFKNKKITYSQLDKYSDSIALRLVQSGVNVGDTVLISMNPCIEFSICEFAVMKAGATYLPVYDRWPLERIDNAIEDCGIKVALYDTEKLFYDCNVEIKIVCENCDDGAVFQGCDEKKNTVCYIIYTSGSSGKPKGVMVSKKNLVSFSMRKSGTYYGNIVGEGHVRVACICPISFDMSVAENTSTLMNGDTVVFADKTDQYPERFGDFIRENGIDIVWSTPSKFKIFLQAEENYSALDMIKAVVVAGEKLDYETAVLSLKHSFKLYNTYGPTETTIISTFHQVEKAEANIPLGVPFANEKCYVLNEEGNVCEVGCRGILWIAGECVSEGYKNSPQLTAERYLPNKFGKGTMYNSGDIVSLEKDGELRFHGRADNQIKINGYRVEIDEIENVITSVTGCKTVVLYIEGRLNAFLNKPKNDIDITVQLKEKLPDYMIPSGIYYLESIPLTSNGKVDRNALIQNVKKERRSGDKVPPGNKDEEFVLSCWKKHLKGIDLGVEDDLYSVGGDSVVAMKIATDLRRGGMPATMFDVINARTVRQSVERIRIIKNKKIDLHICKVSPDLCASPEEHVSLEVYDDYQKNFRYLNDINSYKPTTMKKELMESTTTGERIIYKVEGTNDETVVIKAIKKLIEKNPAFRTVYDRAKNICFEYDYFDGWDIPLLKVEKVNKDFFEYVRIANLKGERQYMSYFFVAKDRNDCLYLIMLVHWRFYDRAASIIIKNALITYLNGEEVHVLGITDPKIYSDLISGEKNFADRKVSEDVHAVLAEFEKLTRREEVNNALRNPVCTHYICSIAPDKKTYRRYVENPLNFVSEIFAGILLDLTDTEKFPVYMVDRNRNALNSDLVDSVIDFIPAVVSRDKTDYFAVMKSVRNIRKCDEMFIQSDIWNHCNYLLPFINYVSVFQEGDDYELVENVNNKWEVIIDEKQDNRITCSGFVQDGKIVLALSLYKDNKEKVLNTINKIIDEYLSD